MALCTVRTKHPIASLTRRLELVCPVQPAVWGSLDLPSVGTSRMVWQALPRANRVLNC
jgi:hypothetical protein